MGTMSLKYPDLEKYPLPEDIGKFYKEYLDTCLPEEKPYYRIINFIGNPYLKYEQAIKFLESVLSESNDTIDDFLPRELCNISHPLLKARIKHILDIYRNKTSFIQEIIEEYSTYFNFLKEKKIIPKWIGQNDDVEDAIELVFKANKYQEYLNIMNFSLYLAKVNLENEPNFRATIPLKTLMAKDRKGVLGIDFYTQIMNHYENVILNLEFQKNPSFFMIFDDMVKCSKRMKDTELINSIKERKKCYLYEQSEKNENIYNRSMFLSNILKMGVPLEERQAIVKKLEDIGKEIIDTMDTHCLELSQESQNLLNNIVNTTKNAIRNSKNIIEALSHIAYNQILIPITPDEWEKMKTDDKNSLANLVAAKQTYGQDGLNTRNIIDAYTIQQKLRCYLLIQFIQEVHLYINPTKEELYPIIANNQLFPQNFLESFSIGLYKVLELDFLTASRFLILNTETLIKHIADMQGILIKNQKGVYFEDKVAIEEILNNPKFHAIVGEDIALELNLILYSNEGFKLRHLMAHGMLDDLASSHLGLLPLWWLWIRILFINTK